MDGSDRTATERSNRMGAADGAGEGTRRRDDETEGWEVGDVAGETREDGEEKGEEAAE